MHYRQHAEPRRWTMMLLLWVILVGVVSLYVVIGLLLYDPSPARVLSASPGL
jgi:signal peptidase I